MRYCKNTKTQIDVRFDSVNDMMAAANFADSHTNPLATAKQRSVNKDRFKERLADEKSDWMIGITDAKSLENLFAKPPQWLLDAGTECLDTINAAVGSRLDAPIKRRRRVGVEDGDSVNIDRFLVRSPEPWERMESHRDTTPIVTITVDLATSARQSREELLWRGAAAVATAMQIERLGGQCEILGINTINRLDVDHKVNMTQVITIKPAHEKATLSSTLICTGHLGFFRYAVINTFFACSKQKVNSVCGYPGNTSSALLQELGSDVHISRDCTTSSKAIAKANEMMESFQKGQAHV